MFSIYLKNSHNFCSLIYRGTIKVPTVCAATRFFRDSRLRLSPKVIYGSDGEDEH
jgi:hypothetical protein